MKLKYELMLLRNYVHLLCSDVAVQSERKPFDVQREKPTNCAASTEKIYIRKDLRSPLIATPTFVADKDGAR